MSTQPQPSPFPQFTSKVNRAGPDFRENSTKWIDILDRFDTASSEAASESKNAAAITKHTAQQILGMLNLNHFGNRELRSDVARDRVALLRDPGTPFLEVCGFAGHKLKESSPSASLVAGIGVVK